MPGKLSRTDKLCLAVVICIFMAGVALLLLSAAVRSDGEEMAETERYNGKEIYINWPSPSKKPSEGTGGITGETGTGTGETGTGTGETGNGTGETGNGTGESGSGTGETDPAETKAPIQTVKEELVLKPLSAEKQYDGTPLLPSGEVSGFEAYENRGYSYKAFISGERVEPGKSASVIDSILLFDPNGKDVTSEFRIIREEGVLHVYERILTFESPNMSKTYDGKPLTMDENYLPFMWESDEKLSCRYVLFGSQTHVGRSVNAFDVRIYKRTSGYSDQDITDHFKIIKVYGELEVTWAKITVKAGDAQKIYDGTPLVCADWELVEGALAWGDSILCCPVVGEQVRLGCSENVVDLDGIVIVNSKGEDVTGDYAIRTEAGTLQVTKP